MGDVTHRVLWTWKLPGWIVKRTWLAVLADYTECGNKQILHTTVLNCNSYSMRPQAEWKVTISRVVISNTAYDIRNSDDQDSCMVGSLSNFRA